MTDGSTAADLVERVRADGRTRFREDEAKQLLASAGVDVPAREVVSSPAAAVEAAERIGYPVVVKVASPAVQHKSEWAGGAGVALDLDDDRAVRAAAERIVDAAEAAGDEGAAADDHGQDIDVDVLVEASVDTAVGVEVIVGGVRDDSFGPVLLFGLGGTFTEVLEDRTYRLAPVSTAEARAMTEAVQATALLDGHRGRPAVDRDALAETIRTVGDLLVERESIRELEVNPLLATPDGAPVALDALATIE